MRRGGPQALTLDAVAAEAGVSKGGLLYHFASKPALLEALFDRWLTAFETAIEARATGEPGGFTRAYVAGSDIVDAPAASPAVEMGLFTRARHGARAARAGARPLRGVAGAPRA